MKKAVSTILALALCFGMCACSSNSSNSSNVTNDPKSTPATITDNEGNTVSKSAKELMDLSSGNEAKFNSLYRGAKITFTGTLKKIETNTALNSSTPYDIVYFEEGWTVFLPMYTYTEVLSTLDIGSQVYVSSNINTCSFLGFVDVRGMADKIGYSDTSMKKTIIRPAN